MNKIVALILIVLITPIIVGIFGIIHEQISYTICKEYYTKFKFISLDVISWGLQGKIEMKEGYEIILKNPRLGITLVGILITWEPSLIIGISLGLMGLIHRNGKEMIIATIKSLLLIIAITSLMSFIGYLYGEFSLNQAWLFPVNITDNKNYISVSYIHNFSYLGGLIGLIIGVIYSVKQHVSFTKNDI